MDVTYLGTVTWMQCVHPAELLPTQIISSCSKSHNLLGVKSGALMNLMKVTTLDPYLHKKMREQERSVIVGASLCEPPRRPNMRDVCESGRLQTVGLMCHISGMTGAKQVGPGKE